MADQLNNSSEKENSDNQINQKRPRDEAPEDAGSDAPRKPKKRAKKTKNPFLLAMELPADLPDPFSEAELDKSRREALQQTGQMRSEMKMLDKKPWMDIVGTSRRDQEGLVVSGERDGRSILYTKGRGGKPVETRLGAVRRENDPGVSHADRNCRLFRMELVLSGSTLDTNTIAEVVSRALAHEGAEIEELTVVDKAVPKEHRLSLLRDYFGRE